MAKRGRKPQAGFVKQLSKMVGKLKAEYETHHSALRTLEGIFQQIGIPIGSDHQDVPPSGGRKPGRPPGRKPGKRGPGRPKGSASTTDTHVGNGLAKGKKSKKGKRGSFSTTGPDSILAFVKKSGAKGATGAEITKHWKGEGRGAGVYPVMGKLVKTKKLKKAKIEGGQGSRYTAG